MDPLLITGSVCYAAALALPAYHSTGFFSIRGRGWKILFLSMILMAVGVAAIAKAEGEKSLFYFLPGALNLFVVALLVLGLCSVRGAGVQILGAMTLGGWAVLFTLMMLKMRGDLQIGSYFWSAASVTLALHGILA